MLIDVINVTQEANAVMQVIILRWISVHGRKSRISCDLNKSTDLFVGSIQFSSTTDFDRLSENEYNIQHKKMPHLFNKLLVHPFSTVHKQTPRFSSRRRCFHRGPTSTIVIRSLNGNSHRSNQVLDSQKNISNSSATGTKIGDELLRDERYNEEELMDSGPTLAGNLTRDEHHLTMNQRAGVPPSKPNNDQSNKWHHSQSWFHWTSSLYQFGKNSVGEMNEKFHKIIDRISQ